MTNEDMSPDRKFIISLQKRCKKGVEKLNEELIYGDGEDERILIGMITVFKRIVSLTEAYLKKEGTENDGEPV